MLQEAMQKTQKKTRASRIPVPLVPLIELEVELSLRAKCNAFICESRKYTYSCRACLASDFHPNLPHASLHGSSRLQEHVAARESSLCAVGGSICIAARKTDKKESGDLALQV